MMFGNRNIYAIEVYHQPLDSSTFFMCGKMCIYLYAKPFGDIDNEYCHLYPAYDTLKNKISNLLELKYDFNLNNDFDIFNFLDDKLYNLHEEDERTYEQICNDMNPYLKFDFMTNAGETFDRTKSFIYMSKNKKIHIMYQNIGDSENDEIICNELDKDIFENTTRGFLKWYEEIENGKNSQLNP
ncbi:MAG: immunity 42 family protein [Spirochaetes bacterium]|nr:immunity 42 family protein [Spirochaetota bacterium]